MLLAWPLTTSSEIAGVLRPGSNLRPDSALRTLRERGLTATAISVIPRSQRGAHGRVVWYSSLMLDAVRLVRVGEDDAAAAAHAAATKLASHRAAAFVAEWLAENGGPQPDLAALDLGTGGALTRLAMLTASAREGLADRAGVRTVTGLVTDVAAGSASVVAPDGTALSIPTPMSSWTDWRGALVSVDIEELAGTATTLWVRPAFDSDTDANVRVPGGPQILSAAERDRLGRATALTR